jgi:hypothetical protein
MNTLIQLKKAPPLFVIALVLACFALSPQAFAQTGFTPTFNPDQWCGCQRRTNVTISTGTSGATISVWGWGGAYIQIPATWTISFPVKRMGSFRLWAQATVGGTTSTVAQSAGPYKYRCPPCQ